MGMLWRRPGDSLRTASRPHFLRPCLLAAFLAFVATSACGQGAEQKGPGSVLNELATALRKGDSAAAYALMSDDYRAQHTRGDFQKQLASNKVEARVLAEALTRPQQTRMYAEVELAQGDRVRLESKAGRWFFATPVIDFYPQSTPREALRSFVHAVDATRWDVVLALMPEAERSYLTSETLGKNLASQSEELERMVALLKASLDSPIEEVGDRATMPYGESFTARFVREGGLWRIEDPE